MKIVLLSLSLFLSLSIAAYKPLSKSEKKQFLKSADALEIAFSERNFEGIQRFAPEILSRYESIVLDPECMKLRPIYKRISDLYIKSGFEIQYDSLQALLKIKTGSPRTTLERYQPLLRFLKDKNDSLFQYHMSVLEGFQDKFFKANPTLNTLHFISSLAFYSIKLWETQSDQLKSELQKEFSNLTFQHDKEKLIEFAKKYPGVFEVEIQSLISRAKLKERASILKKPSLEAIDKYYKSYPEQDKKLDGIAENLFFKMWDTNKSDSLANEFTQRFPRSRYTFTITEWLKSQTIQNVDSSYAGF